MQRSMPRASPTDEELVDTVYSALLGEVSWQNFLDRLTTTLPDCRSTMFFHDAAQGIGQFSLSSGFEETEVAAYNERYCTINPWMPKAVIRPVGRGVVAEQMLPRARLLKTEFYHDYMKPMGCETGVGVTIVREGGCAFMLSSLTSRNDPDANKAEADRLSRLAPHLRRAFSYYRRGAHLALLEETIGSVFETLGVGLLVIGERCKVRAISPLAHRMLEEDIGIRVAPSGCLCVTPGEARDLIEAMTSRLDSAPRAADALIGGGNGQKVVQLVLIRLNKDRFAAYFEGPTVLVLLESLPRAATATGSETLAALHQLTQAETRVLDELVAGSSVADIADTSGLSRETIRSQLKAIFSKLGVNRQTDLVRLADRYRSKIAVRRP